MVCKIEVTITIKRMGEDASKLLPTGIKEVARRWEVEVTMIEEVITREIAMGLPSLTRTDLLNQLYHKARIQRISTSWTIYFSPSKRDLIVLSWNRRYACIGWRKCAQRATTASTFTCTLRRGSRYVSFSKKMASVISRTHSASIDTLKSLSRAPPRNRSSVRIMNEASVKWVGITASFGTFKTTNHTRKSASITRSAFVLTDQIASSHTWKASSIPRICRCRD